MIVLSKTRLAQIVHQCLQSGGLIALMRFCIILLCIGTAGFSTLNAKELTMSSSPLSIHHAQHQSPKSLIKDWVGQIIASARPARATKIFKDPSKSTGSLADKAIVHHLRQRSIREQRHAFLSRLHLEFWRGEDGALFSMNCDHRFKDLFLAKQQVDFDKLIEVWNSVPSSEIVEVGTNSGLLLQYLTLNLPGVSCSTGIDINPDQISKNIASDKFDPRIQFLCTDGQKWIQENANEKTLFVTNGGVLEYFERDKLNDAISHIAENCHPAIFFASEPVALDHDLETNPESIPFGEELSFSHNYRDLFESNGFKVVHQRAVFFESWKMQATIAISQPQTHQKI